MAVFHRASEYLSRSCFYVLRSIRTFRFSAGPQLFLTTTDKKSVIDYLMELTTNVAMSFLF